MYYKSAFGTQQSGLYIGVAFIVGCPHVRGVLYEGLHCTYRNSGRLGG